MKIEKNILVVGCVRNVGDKLINDLQIVQKQSIILRKNIFY